MVCTGVQGPPKENKVPQISQVPQQMKSWQVPSIINIPYPGFSTAENLVGGDKIYKAQ